MKFEAKCISAETQYLYANTCTTAYELERKYCYEIFKKEKLISLMVFVIYLNHLSTSGQMTITAFFKHGSINLLHYFLKLQPPLFGYLHSASRGQGRPGIITFRRHKCHFNVSVQ
ncbi:hypothetical protein T12_6314 [Trichinella patagoniensis]|uniref:Uncharacterized protein n=1 Tax=Trichinella patagoniensis TaxID=990121 RepID=A0A0V0ZEQ5_9BILA|nr:hypothetical protein T12_6314 [Trichinella patagoniensis]